MNSRTALRHQLSALSPATLSWLAAVTLLLFSFLLYAPTLGHPLIWDSRHWIEEDPSVHSLENIPGFFTSGSVQPGEFDSERLSSLGYYRPLVKLSYALQYQLFGSEPAGYHLVSVVLNALVMVAFLFLALDLTGSLKVAAVSTYLYAALPGKAEAVYWVYGQSNLLMALFLVIALLLYARDRWLAGLPAFAAALLCREEAVLFLAILFAYEFLIRPGDTPKKFRRLIPYAGVAVLYLATRTLVVGTTPPLTEIRGFALFNTIAVVLKRFLKILFWPDGPVAIYPLRIFEDFSVEVLVAYGVAIAVGVAFLTLIARQRRLSFWMLWILVWISPWFNIGQFGHFLLTEKGLYLAAAGFAVLLATFFCRRRWGMVPIALLLVVHTTATLVRGTHWRDPETFFTAAVASAPGFVPTRLALSQLYANEARYEEAATELSRIIQLDPSHSLALNNLGNCHYFLGNHQQAFGFWTEALKADPGNAQAAFNLGMVAESTGDHRRAREYYEIYLQHATNPPQELVDKIRAMGGETKSHPDTDEEIRPTPVTD